MIVTLVKYIEEKEGSREVVLRTDRSRLSDGGEQCQVILDKLTLVMLGLGDEQHAYVRKRLKETL